MQKCAWLYARQYSMRRKTVMKRIIQKDSSGCGLACIAMIAGISYRQVRKWSTKIGCSKDGHFDTDASDLRELASCSKIALASRKRQFRSWDKIPHKSIVAINYMEKTDSWHWVVFARDGDRKYVLDPKPSIKSDQRTDFWRMKGKWFLPVDSA